MSPSSNTALFSGNLFLDMLEPVVLPWFSRAVADLAQQKRSIIIVPTHAFSAYIKSVLARQQIATFGVEFWTTSTLRQFLTAKYLPAARAPLREDLSLFARMAAAEVEGITAQGVEHDPESFTRVFEALDRAGHDAVAILQQTHFAPFLEPFLRTRQALAPDTIKVRDRMLRQLAPEQAPLFNQVLICGYHSANWDDLVLLQAALELSETGTVCLEDGRGDHPSTLWLGTWEETYGEITPVDKDSERPYEAVSRAIEAGHPLTEKERPSQPLHLMVSRTVDREADAICTHVSQLLSASPNSRIGVIFAQNDCLSREVSLRLEATEVQHHDTVGFYPAPKENIALFEAWTTLQEEPVLSSLIDLGRLLMRQGKLDATTWSVIEQQFANAILVIAADSIPVLRAYMGPDPKYAEAVAFVNEWPLISEQAPLPEMLSALDAVLQKLEMNDEAERMRKHFPTASEVDIPVSRQHIARWVRDYLKTPGKLRSKTGRNILARVQLVGLEEAARQEFTHIVLAGMTDRQWPPRQLEDSILTDELMDKLNKQVIRQGKAGEGSLMLTAGHGLLITRQHHRARLLERFRTLLETVSGTIACSFRLTGTTKGKDSTGPSEWLLNLAYAWDQTIIDEKYIERLLLQTEASTPLNPARPLLATLPPNSDTRQMEEAFAQRRTPDTPFGPYEFTLEKPPSRPFVFSASVWERLITKPATSWYQHILKVKPLAEHRNKQFWAHTRGNWIHQWIGYQGNPTPVEINAENLPGSHFEQAAQIDLERITNAYLAAGRALPDWFEVQFLEAKQLAKEFRVHLPVLAEPFRLVASECSLPPLLRTHRNNTCPLPIAGKMDVFFCNLPLPQDFDYEATTHDRGPAHVIDFKSGKYENVSTNRLRRGEGLQVVLYMLGLAAMGYSDVQMSVINGDGLKTSNISVMEMLALRILKKGESPDDLTPDEDYWNSLYEIARTGRIGYCGKISDPRNRRYLPTATLDVPLPTLKAKWTLSHPGLMPVTT